MSKYSWPLISVGSKFIQPDKEYLKKNCACTEHIQTFFFQPLLLKQYSKTSIYITFKGNLEMISST